MNKVLLGLGSKARIGKDYAAIKLRDHFDVERVSFADELKKDLSELFLKHGIDMSALLADVKMKEAIRPLLVSYGQTLRKFNPDVWVDAAFNNKEFTHQVTIVTDVRFPNEVARIKQLGGYYIDIVSEIKPANADEALYSPILESIADYKIVNNFDIKYIDDLVVLINTLLDKETI